MSPAAMAEACAWLLMGAGTVGVLVWHLVTFLEFLRLFQARRPWEG